MTVAKFESTYATKDEMLVQASMNNWAQDKRRVEIKKLLHDFMVHAEIEQDGICARCTVKLTQENIQETQLGPFVHIKCHPKSRWPWAPINRYLRRHGVA